MRLSSGIWRRHHSIFIGLVIASSLLMRADWGHLIHIMTTSVSYEHTLYAPLLTVILLWQRAGMLRQFRMPPGPQADSLGVWLLAAAIMLMLVSHVTTIALLGHVAIVLSIWAAFLTAYGRGYAIFFAFALGSLIFMVPFGEFLIPKLQIMSASGAVSLLSLVGFEARSDGVFMYLSGGTYEIVRACAGLHFLTTSAMLGYFLASLLFERFYDRLRILVLALIIPLIANILRVMTIVIIAEVYDFGFAISTDHMIYGWVFLAVISMILIYLTYRLAPSSVKASRPKAFKGGVTAGPLLGFFALIFVVVLVQAFWPSPQILPCVRPEFETISQDWRPVDPASLNWQPRFKGADYSLMQSYRKGADRLDVRIYHYDYQREGAELLSATNSSGSEDFRAQHDQQQTSYYIHQGDKAYVEETVLQSRQGLKLVWTIRYVNGAASYTAVPARLAFLKGRWQGDNLPGTAVLLGVSYDGKNKELARSEIRDFIKESPIVFERRGQCP